MYLYTDYPFGFDCLHLSYPESRNNCASPIPADGCLPQTSSIRDIVVYNRLIRMCSWRRGDDQTNDLNALLMFPKAITKESTKNPDYGNVLKRCFPIRYNLVYYLVWCLDSAVHM